MISYWWILVPIAGLLGYALKSYRTYQFQNIGEVLVRKALRRTFLTGLANKGTAIHILKSLAGHRNISTTATYLYSSPDQLKAAVELI
jgi:integrase/recombinase XerD